MPYLSASTPSIGCRSATLTKLASQAVDLMYKTASGTALYASHPLDRCFRDIHTASQHFVVSTKIVEAAGRVFLGLKPGVPIY